MVKELATRLENVGVDCWYYERDTVAGQSYLSQVHEAICNTRAVVAVVSESSMKSHHVSNEIELSYSKNKPIVTIYRGVTSAKVEAIQPSWALAFGAHCTLRKREAPRKLR